MCVSLMFIFFTVIRCPGVCPLAIIKFCFLSVILKDAFWCIIVVQWWSDCLACAQGDKCEPQHSSYTNIPSYPENDTANMAL